MILSFGVDGSITYNLSSRRLQFKKIYSIVIAVFLLQIIITAIIEYISWLTTKKSWIGQSISLSELYFGVLYLLSLSVIDKYSSFYYGKQLFNLPNISLLAGNLLILAFLGYFYFESGATEIVKWFILLQSIAALIHVFIFHLRTKELPAFSWVTKKDLKVFFHYSSLAFIINIVQFLAYRVDYWFLDYYSDGQQLGWYSLATRITQFFWILPSLYASILLPKIADTEQHFATEKLLSLMRITNAIAFVGIIILFITSGWLIPFLFGSEYDYSSLLIKILLPGVFIFCASNLIAAYYAGKGKLGINLLGSGFALASIIILDVLLIPGYAAKGAAIAASASYSVTTLYFVIIFCRDNKLSPASIFIPKKEDWNRSFNLFKIKSVKI